MMSFLHFVLVSICFSFQQCLSQRILVDTIPINVLHADGSSIVATFDLVDSNSSDPIEQADNFCQLYLLSEESCSLIGATAVDMFEAYLRNKTNETEVRVIIPEEKLFFEINESQTPTTIVGGALLETVPLRMLSVLNGEFVDIDFHLYSDADAAIQAKSFCEKYEMKIDSCSLLVDRAVEAYSNHISKNYEDRSYETQDHIHEEVHEKDKNDFSVIHSIPVLFIPVAAVDRDGSDEVEVRFLLRDSPDPQEQVNTFCREHVIPDGVCSQLMKRSIEIHETYIKLISLLKQDAISPVSSSDMSSTDLIDAHVDTATSTTPATPPQSDLEVIGRIPVSLQGAGDLFLSVEFLLYDSSDPVEQAQKFCLFYDLPKQHCFQFSTLVADSYNSYQLELESGLAPEEVGGYEMNPQQTELQISELDTSETKSSILSPVTASASISSDDLLDILIWGLTFADKFAPTPNEINAHSSEPAVASNRLSNSSTLHNISGSLGSTSDSIVDIIEYSGDANKDNENILLRYALSDEYFALSVNRDKSQMA